MRLYQKSLLLASVSILAASQAFAQDASSASTEQVVVTGSRTIKDGTQAPTPTTVVSAESLEAVAPNTLASGLNQLPQFLGSAQSENINRGKTNGVNGQNVLALRGLGVQRTLVLFDGRRFISANSLGTVDVNDLPAQLIKRVDIVTGGASAAYGSDAVAGVVNFILDEKFQGFKANAQVGIAGRGDYDNYKLGVAWGDDFAGGRGHVIASLDVYKINNPGLRFNEDRPWAKTIGTAITNPVAGARPTRIRIPDTRDSASSFGGLITTAGPLKGIQFGPGGVIQQHDYGTLTNGSFQNGGDSTAVYDPYGWSGFQRPQATGFLHATYDLTPDLTAFAEATTTYQHGGYVSYYQYHDQVTSNPLTIFQDNAFLPATVRSTMVANNISSFSMGRFDTEYGPIGFLSTQKVYSFATGLKGKVLGFDFNSHYSHGWSIFSLNASGFKEQNYYAAIDSVINPATGQAACRSTLLFGLNPGCVPYNPFGQGSPSAAAVSYVTGIGARKDKYQQDAASIDARRDLFSLWSDPITVAAGMEWREESLTRTTDATQVSTIDFTGVRGGPPAEANRQGGYQTGNDLPFTGSYSVIEGFTEVNVPVVKDLPLIKSFDMNLAGRLTSYSTSGEVETWKIGGVYSPIDELKLRGTLSVDIRAPNLSELDGAGIVRGATSCCVNPLTKVAVSFSGVNNAGNPNLQPEIARTKTFGAVYQPDWLSGFNLSLDYYDIKMTKALAVGTEQDTLNQCLLQSVPIACSQLVTVAPTFVIWRQVYQNLANARTTGVDLEANYSVPLWDGQLSTRLIVNYLTEESTQTVGAKKIDLAGQYNRPYWRGLFQGTYAWDTWSVTGQGRFSGAGKFNRTFVEGIDIDNNRVKPVMYFDLTVTKDLTFQNTPFQAYFTINNLFDRTPPNAGVSNGVLDATDPNYYDEIGARVTAGIRVSL